MWCGCSNLNRRILYSRKVLTNFLPPLFIWMNVKITEICCQGRNQDFLTERQSGDGERECKYSARKIKKKQFFKAKNINDGVGQLAADGGIRGHFREVVTPLPAVSIGAAGEFF